MELTSEYSSWNLIWCAVLAGLYTFLLYSRNKQNVTLPTWVVQILGVLRFSSVFILCVLLLNPLINKWITHTEPPLIIIAQDVSASVINNADSNYYKTTYLTELNAFKANLGANYKVVSLSFGDKVNLNDTGVHFTDKQTHISEVFDEIEARYAGNNIGALVLASDGLFNIGANPKYYQFSNNYPIYTIGLGDTNLKSDISLSDIRANSMVYLGNSFPVRVSVNAKLLAGETAYLKVFNKGKLIDKRILKIDNRDLFFTESFVFKAEQEGTQRYKFEVSPFSNELNTINNYSQVLVDVLDNRDKILIVADAPHPDVAAIRNVLREKESVEVDVALVTEIRKNINAYNLIIAHGFSARKHQIYWRKIWDAQVPLWAIVPGDMALGQLNAYRSGFTANGRKGRSNRISPSLNPDFNAFKLSSESVAFLNQVPPLYSAFGEIDSFDISQTFLYQKLGSVETDLPLIYFDKRNEVKTAWLFGDGIWQWKMYDYRENGETKHFQELISKMVQYLSAKEDKSRFRVKTNKRFKENENVIVNAEFYNKSYELINDENIEFTLTNEQKQQFNYVFNAFGSTYNLDLGKLKPGTYFYKAQLKEGITQFTKMGSFIIEPVNVEWTSGAANFTLLQELSEQSGGQFFVPQQFNELSALFENETAFPSISYSSELNQSILHEKWIALLLLLLLSMEWFIRKYKGRY